MEDMFAEALGQVEMEDKFEEALGQVEMEDKFEAQLIEDEMDQRIRQILANDDLHQQKTQLLKEVDRIDLKIKQMDAQTSLSGNSTGGDNGTTGGDAGGSTEEPKGISTWVWVVIGIVALLGGFAIWKFMSGSKTENEGGEDDRYTKFVDKTLST